MTYKATDEDLPSIFWPEGSPEKVRIDTDAQLVREVAVQLHFPAVIYEKSVKQVEREQRAVRRDHVESVKPPTYVRLKKLLQMYSWLVALSPQFHVMDSGEESFCASLMSKFKRYTPYRTKYVTRKQYDWLNRIAATYLKLPEVSK